MTTPAPWLVVVDMQECFADPASDWAVPLYSAVTPAVTQLIEAAQDRVVFTRFVSGAADAPGWVDYYARWPAMQKGADDPAWELTLVPPSDAHVVTLTTFSKWAGLAGVIPLGAPVVVCGVATEVCVLATVLDAVDEGRSVVLVAEACAGASSQSHTAALCVLESFAPNVEVTDLEAATTMLQQHAERM